MYLGISLHLHHEGKVRIAGCNGCAGFMICSSRMQVTMATPTLSNARKPYHQLSSCFIDTVPDSLEGIYRSVDNFAQSVNLAGEHGLVFPERSGQREAGFGDLRGCRRRDPPGLSWWNDTAVAVDQLGMRQGAAAVYLDAWHKDLPEFLQLRTNNGDDRMKAHDIFPAVCFPDLFWKMAEENLDQDWHLMCPHEIRTVKGYCLEGLLWGAVGGTVSGLRREMTGYPSALCC